jgi:uncharacterized protein with NAD-binding domain and iron-sulfur cluster
MHYGGKAASLNIGQNDNPYTSGPEGLPGEHGFRFFPGWYKHLPDTLGRIPYKDKKVSHNLVAADINLLVSYFRDPVQALIRIPTTLEELKTATRLPGELLKLGLTPKDFTFFFSKLLEFMTCSEEHRIAKYDNITWWDFLEADARSPEFRAYLVEAATRNTVAARPKEASAYVIAKVALQTLFDTLTPQTAFDRVLNGPTNEVWIDPWVDYLRGLGVWFHDGYELDEILIKDRKIESVSFLQTQEIRRARAQLEFLETVSAHLDPVDGVPGVRQNVDAVKAVVNGMNQGVAPDGTFDELCRGFDELWPFLDNDEMPFAQLGHTFWGGPDAVGGLNKAQTDFVSVVKKAHGMSMAEVRKLRAIVEDRSAHYHTGGLEKRLKDAVAKAAKALALVSGHTDGVGADYFIFALPVEQMAYYVNCSETLRRYDPSLKNIILLSEHVDWMAGIQFYLSDVVNVTRGHIDLLDSEWALTAISEVQFWKDVDLKDRGVGSEQGKTKSILSVDISAWGKRGRFLRKEAFNCSRAEIAAEVWHQLKTSLNRPQKAPVLKNQMLLGWTVGVDNDMSLPIESYYLDDNVVDILDRKKQALYGKFLTVRFSAAELVRKQEHRGTESETSFMYGQRQQINVEPLLINRVGALNLRPEARTEITNMFLAGDYVRTNTLLATMEGANESARAAVNELLATAGSHESPCKIWPLSEPLAFAPARMLEGILYRRGQRFQDTYTDIPVRAVAGMAEAAGRLAAVALEKFLTPKK